MPRCCFPNRSFPPELFPAITTIHNNTLSALPSIRLLFPSAGLNYFFLRPKQHKLGPHPPPLPALFNTHTSNVCFCDSESHRSHERAFSLSTEDAFNVFNIVMHLLSLASPSPPNPTSLSHLEKIILRIFSIASLLDQCKAEKIFCLITSSAFFHFSFQNAIFSTKQCFRLHASLFNRRVHSAGSFPSRSQTLSTVSLLHSFPKCQQKF